MNDSVYPILKAQYAWGFSGGRRKVFSSVEVMDRRAATEGETSLLRMRKRCLTIFLSLS